MSELLKELSLVGKSCDRNAVFIASNVDIVLPGDELTLPSLDDLNENEDRFTNPVFFDLAACALCNSGVELTLHENWMLVIAPEDVSRDIEGDVNLALTRHFDLVDNDSRRHDSFLDKLRNRSRLELDFTAFSQLKNPH